MDTKVTELANFFFLIVVVATFKIHLKGEDHTGLVYSAFFIIKSSNFKCRFEINAMRLTN